MAGVRLPPPSGSRGVVSNPPPLICPPHLYFQGSKESLGLGEGQPLWLGENAPILQTIPDLALVLFFSTDKFSGSPAIPRGNLRQDFFEGE